jgi:hypothetical protein
MDTIYTFRCIKDPILTSLSKNIIYKFSVGFYYNFVINNEIYIARDDLNRKISMTRNEFKKFFWYG